MKALLLFLMCMCLSAGTTFADDFVKAGNKADNNTEVNLISTDNLKTVIDVRVNGFYTKKLEMQGTAYDNIYLKDFVSLGNAGQAALPTITKMIAIPDHKDVRISVNNSEYQVFDSYNVMPYQTPALRNTNGITGAFEKDMTYYSDNRDSPHEIVSLKEIAVLRDYRIAVVTINPIQYNPVSGQLRVYTDINFELRYEGNSDINNVSYHTRGISRSFRNIYRNVIFNYTDNNTFTEAPNMLVIVADSLYNSILPYTRWKTKKGIRTTIKKSSELGVFGDPTAVQIKNYLTSQYNSPERPEFVLFVGDVRGVNTLSWFDAQGGKSDHPYQCLDGTDILPDIVVGRISVQSAGELDSAVTKFIQYEKQPNMTQTDWYKRALVLHSTDGIDPINGQVARSVFLDEGGFTNVDMANPSTTQNQITSFLNGGVSWVWFIGHGNEISWATPVWNMSQMVNLNFGYRQPNIISIACSNADLDYAVTADCFGEAWVERSPQNSATNICASTELCAFYTTDTLGREMLYAYFRHGIYDFGSMMNYGKIQAYNYFNGNGTVVETIDQYMVLGDPTIESYSDVPKSLNIVSSLVSNEYRINVKAAGQNAEGALVAVNQNGDLKISGYTDTQGNYIFSSSEIAEGVPVNLVVTGKNLAPYDGSMILTSVISSSEIPDGFALSQNYPNPFNPSTNINFSIPKNSFVTLKVYDMLGKEVATLVSENLNQGIYDISFNASGLTSGIYFYRLTAGDYNGIRKMSLLK